MAKPSTTLFEINVVDPRHVKMGRIVLNFASGEVATETARALRKKGYSVDDLHWPTTLYPNVGTAVESVDTFYGNREK